MALDLSVLDRRPLQEVVHLDSKNGSSAAFILRALGTCSPTANQRAEGRSPAMT